MTLRLAVLTFFSAIAIFAQAPARPDIVEMMEATNATVAMDKMFTIETLEAQMRGMMRPENAPPEQRAKMEKFIKEFAKEFSVEVNQKRQVLLDMTASVYAKHYTPEDVKAILAFYRTPAGKKVASAAPQIGIEVMQQAQAWGQQLGQQVGQRVGQRIEAEAGAPPTKK